MANVNRKQISHAQRSTLRQHFQSITPHPTHAELKTWFQAKFGREISQSCISRTLSNDFKFLDEGIAKASRYRTRDCQGPWLERPLTDWIFKNNDQSVTVSNVDISCHAKHIWKNSVESRGLKTPSFSAGWIANFKRRLADQNSQRDTLPSESADTEAITLSQRDKPHSHEWTWSTMFPISSDHLIHLIQQNVHNALSLNKDLIRKNGLILDASNSIGFPKQFATQVCGGLTVIRPLNPGGIPNTLYPTQLQMTCAHTVWLDSFPFPRFRDNLINKGVDFVPEHLLTDLFDELFPAVRCWAKSVIESAASSSASSLAPSVLGSISPASEKEIASQSDEFEEMDDYTFGRGGMISWGNPWSVEDWEVTPGFLRKWRWALEGCDDLIYASNRWRASRNERLIPWS